MAGCLRTVDVTLASMPSRGVRIVASLPLDPLLFVIQQLLDTLIRNGDNSKRDEHDSLARALLPMPLVCKEASQLMFQCTPSILAYEAARLGMKGRFFYDCMPARLLFRANQGDEVGFKCSHKHISPINQFRADCQDSARFLDASTDEVVTNLIQHHDAPDLMHAPVVVRVFIGRARHVSREIENKENSLNCRVCSQSVVIDDTKLVDEQPDAKYWRCAGGQPLSISRMPVCSGVCASALFNDIETAQGVSKEELRDYDAPPGLHNSRRVHATLRQAFRRNELVARRLRRVGPLRFLTEDEARQMRVFSSTMLNVDLALLLCCERAVTHHAYRNTILPTQYMLFREHEPIWVNPLLRSVKLYERLTRGSSPNSPVCTLLNKPRWLTTIVDAFREILNSA